LFKSLRTTAVDACVSLSFMFFFHCRLSAGKSKAVSVFVFQANIALHTFTTNSFETVRLNLILSVSDLSKHSVEQCYRNMHRFAFC